ncbi:MAG: DUF2569 family protein [Myxococcaceae bacterium]
MSAKTAAPALGGWLAVFGAWLFAQIFPPAKEIFEMVEKLRSTDARLAAAWSDLIVGMVADGGLLLFSLLVGWRFITCDRRFPRLVTAFLIVRLVLTTVSALFWYEEPLHLVGIGLGVAIGIGWIAYFQKSRRVKETFVAG